MQEVSVEFCNKMATTNQDYYGYHPHQHHHHQAYHQQMGPATVAHPVAGYPMGQTTVESAQNCNQQVVEMTKSTKGASKQRRDQINAEIAQLRELLPLPASTRQRLSQLQLMALVLVYVRKSNYFGTGELFFRLSIESVELFSPINLSAVNIIK